MNKGISTVVGLGIIALLLIVAGGVYWQMSREDLPPAYSPTTQEVNQRENTPENTEGDAEYEIYTDATLSFSYPEIWQLVPSDPKSTAAPSLANGMVLAMNPSPIIGSLIGGDRYQADGQVGLGLSVNGEFDTPEKLIDVYGEERIDGTSSYTVDGHSAIQVDIQWEAGDGFNAAVTDLFISLDAGNYIILSWNRQDADDVRIKNQILSTLQLK